MPASSRHYFKEEPAIWELYQTVHKVARKRGENKEEEKKGMNKHHDNWEEKEDAALICGGEGKEDVFPSRTIGRLKNTSLGDSSLRSVLSEGVLYLLNRRRLVSGE